MQASRLTAVVLTAALLGCSSATIERNTGNNIDGMIVGGNKDFLYVLRDDDQMVKVRRAKVRDIDHPGNVLMVIGLPLVALGLTYAMAGAASGLPNDQRSVFYAGGATYGVIGLALAIPGYISWSASRSAADPEDNIDTRPLGNVQEMPDWETSAAEDEKQLLGEQSAAHPPAAMPVPLTPTDVEPPGADTP